MEQSQAAAGALRVVVFADFVCPYSYLAVDQIDRLACEYDVKPLWRPHWLHPDTPPEGCPRESTPESAAKRERQNSWMREMAPEQYARMRLPRRRHYSFRAFEALEFAYDCDLDFAYKTVLYELMWTEGRDIGETATLLEAGERVGLDSGELKVALDERLYAQRTLDAVNQARSIGITCTPTIFIGRTRINGWHYYEVLQSVMEKQGARGRAAVAG
ncbi:MAG: DsbA family protein [Burkholderiales bacterium]|nr:DsbA family protein [Burkholderiales bacterium]